MPIKRTLDNEIKRVNQISKESRRDRKNCGDSYTFPIF